jgi:hypothetical protein
MNCFYPLLKALEWQIAVSKGLDLYVHIRGKTFHVARKSMYISGGFIAFVPFWTIVD